MGLIDAELLRRWHLTFMRCRELGWRLGESRLMIMMVYLICMFVLAIGEDGFEKPYNVIPFYLFWGIVLRFAYLLERGESGPRPRTMRSRSRDPRAPRRRCVVAENPLPFRGGGGDPRLDRGVHGEAGRAAASAGMDVAVKPRHNRWGDRRG